jgi:catechol 2,3-dioxygenase-like lactoylglutathione lyase family enzyme
MLRVGTDSVAGMALQRMDHVGIVVDDLAAATAFFVALGLESLGDASAEGEALDRIVGLEGARTDVTMLQTPDGHSRLEVIEFHSPPAADGDRDAPANVPGLRHITFAVDDLDATLADLRPHGAELVGEVVRYGDSYRLCYLRGPAGIIVELAEAIAGGD